MNCKIVKNKEMYNLQLNFKNTLMECIIKRHKIKKA